MKKALLFAAMMLILGAAGVVTAQPEFAPEVPDFTEVDINDDGVLSRDEAALVEGLDFDAADKDRNGVLSEGEYNAAMGGEAIILEEEKPSEDEEPAD